MEFKCKNCKHWGVYQNEVLSPCKNTKAFATELDEDALMRAIVDEKALAIVNSEMSRTGIVHTTGEFGCIFFEQKV